MFWTYALITIKFRNVLLVYTVPLLPFCNCYYGTLLFTNLEIIKPQWMSRWMSRWINWWINQSQQSSVPQHSTNPYTNMAKVQQYGFITVQEFVRQFSPINDQPVILCRSVAHRTHPRRLLLVHQQERQSIKTLKVVAGVCSTRNRYAHLAELHKKTHFFGTHRSLSWCSQTQWEKEAYKIKSILRVIFLNTRTWRGCCSQHKTPKNLTSAAFYRKI